MKSKIEYDPRVHYLHKEIADLTGLSLTRLSWLRKISMMPEAENEGEKPLIFSRSVIDEWMGTAEYREVRARSRNTHLLQ